MAKKAVDGPPVDKMVDGAGGEKKEAEAQEDLGAEPIFDGDTVNLAERIGRLEDTVETIGMGMQELDAVSEIHTREIKDLVRAKGKGGAPAKVECQDCEAWDGVASRCCMGPIAQAKTFNDWCMAGIVNEQRRALRLNREGKKG